MESRLIFNLPEEATEFRLACDGARWHSLVFDLDMWLRGLLKHGDRKDVDTLEQVRKKLHEMAEESNLNIIDPG